MFPNRNKLKYRNFYDPNIPDREGENMKTVKEIGKEVRQARKQLGVTQRDLAMTAGTGLRFVVELEQGKETLQIGKVLDVLQALGLRLEMRSAGGGRS